MYSSPMGQVQTASSALAALNITVLAVTVPYDKNLGGIRCTEQKVGLNAVLHLPWDGVTRLKMI